MPIDFKHLRSRVNDGQRFQDLVRQIGQQKGFGAKFNGVGPDAGLDIVFEETCVGNIYSYKIRWLVQCKDFSMSGNHVSELDVGCVYEKTIQHRCQGYLLASTTNLTAGLTQMLNALDWNSGGPIYVAIWDKTYLEAYLLMHEHAGVLHQFFPDQRV